jgi:hypothetical protein
MSPETTIQKARKTTAGDSGAKHCSCFFSYSVRRGGRYSYLKRSSIAIRPIGPQVTANRFDQRSAVPQFKQPSSTSTVSLSTASLSTSRTKSEAMHERTLCSCKLRLRRAGPTVGLHSGHRALLGLRRLYAGGANPAATMPHTLPGRNAPGPRLACPTGSQASRANRKPSFAS